MSTTVVICNAKGGTAKTTTSVTLATGLASMGHRTLLVDCDAQPGNATAFLGLDRMPGLFNLLVARRPLKDCITHVDGYGGDLSIITSDDDTLTVNTVLSSPASKVPLQDILRLALSKVGGYKYILLDTAPTLTYMQVAALGAADFLLVPTTPEWAGEAGVSQVAQAVEALQAQGSNLRLLGVLPVMVDARTREHRRALDELTATFGDLLYPRVRRTIRLGETPRAGVPIWVHAPDSDAAKDYSAVLLRFFQDMRDEYGPA